MPVAVAVGYFVHRQGNSLLLPSALALVVLYAAVYLGVRFVPITLQVSNPVVVWTTVLLFSLRIVIRYFPAYWKPYMLGLATVFAFVVFFVRRRKQDIEDDMIRKVKDRLKLTDSDSPSRVPWEG